MSSLANALPDTTQTPNDLHSCPCGEPLRTVQHVILSGLLHRAARPPRPSQSHSLTSQIRKSGPGKFTFMYPYLTRTSLPISFRPPSSGGRVFVLRVHAAPYKCRNLLSLSLSLSLRFTAYLPFFLSSGPQESGVTPEICILQLQALDPAYQRANPN
jgi:hypothetical protein